MLGHDFSDSVHNGVHLGHGPHAWGAERGQSSARDWGPLRPSLGPHLAHLGPRTPASWPRTGSLCSRRPGAGPAAGRSAGAPTWLCSWPDRRTGVCCGPRPGAHRSVRGGGAITGQGPRQVEGGHPDPPPLLKGGLVMPLLPTELVRQAPQDTQGFLRIRFPSPGLSSSCLPPGMQEASLGRVVM